jgi:magnesium transporter
MLFVHSAEGGRLVASTPNLADHAPQRAAVWFDLIEPSAAERAWVDAQAGVEIPSREEMEEIEVSSRLYNEDGVEYMTITAVARLDTDEPMRTPILFVLNRNTLVTVRYQQIKPFANVIDRLGRQQGAANAGAESIMLTLLEALVDRLADALEWIGGKIDGISHDVFGKRNATNRVKRDRDLQATIEVVGREGDLLGLVRESLVSLNRLAGFHHGLGVGHGERPSGEARARIRTLQRDVAALSDHASYLGTKVNFLLDATLGLINLEQNQIIKIFSIAAVCLMPPTLVASVYGMNFKHLPELAFEYGYPMALALMLLTGVAPYLYFKRRGWL